MLGNVLENFFFWIGLYTFIWFSYDNFKNPLMYLWLRMHEHFTGQQRPTLKERYGNWAAITGASDGIGKAYAEEIAKQGINVVLISRTEAKLNSLALEIEKNYGVQTKVVVCDFTEGDSVYEKLEEQLDDIPLGILVNNVGTSTPKPDWFHNFSQKEITDVIYTNIFPATELSRYFLQRMVKRNIKGIIVNVSSFLYCINVAKGATYIATKAYITALTRSLNREAKQHGIQVQLVLPCFVQTKINNYSSLLMDGFWAVADVRKYGKYATERIGLVDETSGYFWHGFHHTIFKLVPWQLRSKCLEICLAYQKPKQN